MISLAVLLCFGLLFVLSWLWLSIVFVVAVMVLFWGPLLFVAVIGVAVMVRGRHRHSPRQVHSAGVNFFKPCHVVCGKFWSRFAWILLKMREMWSSDSVILRKSLKLLPPDVRYLG